jgi:hypothetical protein
MFFPELPSYYPGAIYADLLEWHRQVRLGSCEFCFGFASEEFALVVARAELAGLLASVGRIDGPDERMLLENRAKEITAGLQRRRESVLRMEKYYRRHFVALTKRYGPGVGHTVTKYAEARARWEEAFQHQDISVFEAFADKLVDITENILRMLDFDPPPSLLSPLNEF